MSLQISDEVLEQYKAWVLDKSPALSEGDILVMHKLANIAVSAARAGCACPRPDVSA